MSKGKKNHSILNFDGLRSYCLARPGATLDFPFGPEVAVFRVAGKMFALCIPEQQPLKINLKCEPRLAELLREEYEAVVPGWHMNKRHWNTVTLGHDLPDALVCDQIDRSYGLIVAGLPKKVRAELQAGSA
ncbi:MAG TPA: MmcQ/YjbR family DNA-binding protein [Candidatus Obscuribacterales bacterium]